MFPNYIFNKTNHRKRLFIYRKRYIFAIVNDEYRLQTDKTIAVRLIKPHLHFPKANITNGVEKSKRIKHKCS